MINSKIRNLLKFINKYLLMICLTFVFWGILNNLVNGENLVSSEIKVVASISLTKIMKDMCITGINRSDFTQNLKKQCQKVTVDGTFETLIVEPMEAEFRGYEILDSSNKPKIVFFRFGGAMMGWDYILVIAQKENDKWIIKDSVKEISKYAIPKVNFYKLKNHLFTASLNSSGGSNVYEEFYDVFEVKDGKLKNVLQYPSNGRRDMWALPFSTTYEVNIKNPKLNYSQEFLEFIAKVSYFADECEDYEPKNGNELKLFTKNYKLRFLWDEEKQTFSIEPNSTDLNKLLSKKYYLFGPTDEWFLFYLVEFEKLAKTNNPILKKWFNCLLDDEDVKKKAPTQRKRILKMLEN